MFDKEITRTKDILDKGGKTKCLSNEIKIKKDKHMEYFYEDYNEAYNIESNNVTRSIVPFQNLKYYKNNNYNQNNKLNKYLSAWTLDSGTTYHITENKDHLRCIKV